MAECFFLGIRPLPMREGCLWCKGFSLWRTCIDLSSPSAAFPGLLKPSRWSLLLTAISSSLEVAPGDFGSKAEDEDSPAKGFGADCICVWTYFFQSATLRVYPRLLFESIFPLYCGLSCTVEVDVLGGLKGSSPCLVPSREEKTSGWLGRQRSGSGLPVRKDGACAGPMVCRVTYRRDAPGSLLWMLKFSYFRNMLNSCSRYRLLCVLDQWPSARCCPALILESLSSSMAQASEPEERAVPCVPWRITVCSPTIDLFNFFYLSF